MYAIEIIVDSFATCCFSDYIVVISVKSFKIMTEHCFIKGLKTEDKHD